MGHHQRSSKSCRPTGAIRGNGEEAQRLPRWLRHCMYLPKTRRSPNFHFRKHEADQHIQILFFTDRPTVQSMQQKFALYADKFPIWATQSDGMHQYAIWTALEAEGLGANLQHYNPLIDQKVQQEWNVSKDWELSAQMVIGAPAAEPGEKSFQKVEGERLIVHGV
jgi:predicted oxidoreductase (fatty acid repression mutant protein)